MSREEKYFAELNVRIAAVKTTVDDQKQSWQNFKELEALSRSISEYMPEILQAGVSEHCASGNKIIQELVDLWTQLAGKMKSWNDRFKCHCEILQLVNRSSNLYLRARVHIAVSYDNEGYYSFYTSSPIPVEHRNRYVKDHLPRLVASLYDALEGDGKNCWTYPAAIEGLITLCLDLIHTSDDPEIIRAAVHCFVADLTPLVYKKGRGWEKSTLSNQVGLFQLAQAMEGNKEHSHVVQQQVIAVLQESATAAGTDASAISDAYNAIDFHYCSWKHYEAVQADHPLPVAEIVKNYQFFLDTVDRCIKGNLAGFVGTDRFSSVQGEEKFLEIQDRIEKDPRLPESDKTKLLSKSQVILCDLVDNCFEVQKTAKNEFAIYQARTMPYFLLNPEKLGKFADNFHQTLARPNVQPELKARIVPSLVKVYQYQARLIVRSEWFTSVSLTQLGQEIERAQDLASILKAIDSTLKKQGWQLWLRFAKKLGFLDLERKLEAFNRLRALRAQLVNHVPPTVEAAVEDNNAPADVATAVETSTVPVADMTASAKAAVAAAVDTSVTTALATPPTASVATTVTAVLAASVAEAPAVIPATPVTSDDSVKIKKDEEKDLAPVTSVVDGVDCIKNGQGHVAVTDGEEEKPALVEAPTAAVIVSKGAVVQDHSLKTVRQFNDKVAIAHSLQALYNVSARGGAEVCGKSATATDGACSQAIEMGVLVAGKLAPELRAG